MIIMIVMKQWLEINHICIFIYSAQVIVGSDQGDSIITSNQTMPSTCKEIPLGHHLIVFLNTLIATFIRLKDELFLFIF